MRLAGTSLIGRICTPLAWFVITGAGGSRLVMPSTAPHESSLACASATELTAAESLGQWRVPPVGIWPRPADGSEPLATATASGDVWIGPLPPAAPNPREHVAAIYDSVRDRLIVIGGFPIANDVWSLQLSGTPSWTQLAPAGLLPARRFAHAAIHDQQRDRVIVFGGFRGPDYALLNDVWELSLGSSPTWTQVLPSGTAPSPREGFALVYDPTGDRLILFGGYDGSHFLADVWVLTLAGAPTWSRIEPAGSPPAGRNHPLWAYDSRRSRMIIFGGFDGSNYLGDAWSLSLAPDPVWAPVTAAGPAPLARREGSAVYDPIRDRMVVFGGFRGGALSDSWELSLGSAPAWSLLSTSGSSPGGRYGHAGVLDLRADRLLVFGGVGAGYQRDVHALDLSPSGPLWTDLTPSLAVIPAPRFGASVFLDPSRNRLVLFGGDGRTGGRFGDLWALSLGAIPSWTRLQPVGSPPEASPHRLGVLDSARDRILFLGDSGFQTATWTLTMGDPPAWSPDLPRPPQYVDATTSVAVVDRLADRVIVASLWGPALFAMPLGGNPVWSQLPTAGGLPPSRIQTAGAFDSRRNRILFIGGLEGQFQQLTNTVISLTLSGTPTWSQFSVAGALPPPRAGHGMYYDPIRDRMVIFGGAGYGFLDDIWELSLGVNPAWTRLAPSGSPPIPRNFPSVAYDPVGDRMIMFGGHNEGIPLDDTRFIEWHVTTAATVSLVRASGVAGDARIVWEVQAAHGAEVHLERNEDGAAWRRGKQLQPDGSSRVEFVDNDVAAGRRYGYRLVVRDASSEFVSGETWIEIPSSSVLALEGAWPNPVSDRMVVGVSLPDERPATLELFESSGRRIARRDVGSLGAGRHLLAIDEARDLAPGLYFLRLSRGERALMSKVCVVR